MAKETHVGAGLPGLVTRLRNLMPPEMMADFEKLNTYQINAGPPGIDTAQWLEDVVKDRRAGLIAHAKLMQSTFTSLAEAIDDVARVLTGTDSDAASGLDSLRTWLTTSDPTSLPPVTHAYPKGKETYDTEDRGGDPQLAFGVTAGGDHVSGKGGVVVDLPNKKDAPAPDLYQDFFKDLPKQPGSSKMTTPEFMFISDDYVVK